jgi:hypothetical protein
LNPRLKANLPNIYKIIPFEFILGKKTGKLPKILPLNFPQTPKGAMFVYPNDMTPLFAYWESARRMLLRRKRKQVLLEKY